MKSLPLCVHSLGDQYGDKCHSVCWKELTYEEGTNMKAYSSVSESCTEEILGLSEITRTCFQAGGTLDGILKHFCGPQHQVSRELGRNVECLNQDLHFCDAPAGSVHSEVRSTALFFRRSFLGLEEINRESSGRLAEHKQTLQRLLCV